MAQRHRGQTVLQRIADSYRLSTGAEIDDSRINVHEARGRIQNAPVADGADVGALLEAHPQLLGVIVDAGAAANHSLVVAAHFPGEAQGRREVVGIVLGRA